MPCMQSRQLAELWIFGAPASGFRSNANDRCLEASLEVGPVQLAECTGWSGSGPSRTRSTGRSDQTTTYCLERYDMDACGYGQGHMADCDGSFGQHWAVTRAE
jgi:hypothetical protein